MPASRLQSGLRAGALVKVRAGSGMIVFPGRRVWCRNGTAEPLRGRVLELVDAQRVRVAWDDGLRTVIRSERLT